MNSAAFVTLIQNAALLLVMTFIFDYLARYMRQQSLTFRLIAGAVLGVISIAVMTLAWELPNGVIFDTRSVVLSLGTLFYGTVPGLIGGVIAATFRASQGGPGVYMGVAVIAMSVAVGIVWRRWRRVAQRDPSVLELYLFGLTVHVCMLALTVLLPRASVVGTLTSIAVPVLVIYPLASVLLGVLMIDQRRRRRSEQALRRSEERFSAFADHVPGHLWICDSALRYVFVNRRLASDLDCREEDLLGRTPEDVWGRETGTRMREVFARALNGEVVDCVERLSDADDTSYRTLAFAMSSEEEDALIGGLDFDVTEQQRAREELERQAERLRTTMEGAVHAMSSIVERRDPYTAGHERRVAELAEVIGARLHIPSARLDGLRLAAGIHDVGKISVPAEILSKPGRLTENEFALIKEHPQAGHDMLRAIAFEQPVAEMVLQHHERLDGSGYPGGLRGDEILVEARIIAVADVYEAMTSHRPYRPGLPRDTAVAELRDGAGTRYDPEVVDACLGALGAGFAFTVD